MTATITKAMRVEKGEVRSVEVWYRAMAGEVVVTTIHEDRSHHQIRLSPDAADRMADHLKSAAEMARFQVSGKSKPVL